MGWWLVQLFSSVGSPVFSRSVSFFHAYLSSPGGEDVKISVSCSNNFQILARKQLLVTHFFTTLLVYNTSFLPLRKIHARHKVSHSWWAHPESVAQRLRGPVHFFERHQFKNATFLITTSFFRSVNRTVVSLQICKFVSAVWLDEMNDSNLNYCQIGCVKESIINHLIDEFSSDNPHPYNDISLCCPNTNL